MSLAFSIIRISHPSSRLRMVANLTAGIFACCFASQIVQKVYICRDIKSWMNSTQGCRADNALAVTEICCACCPLSKGSHLVSTFTVDVVSDFLLMAMASRLLRDARQLKNQRKLIHGLFSASILTTLASIVHIIFVIRKDVLLAITMTAQLEVCCPTFNVETDPYSLCELGCYIAHCLQPAGGGYILLPSCQANARRGRVRLCHGVLLGPCALGKYPGCKCHHANRAYLLCGSHDNHFYSNRAHFAEPENAIIPYNISRAQCSNSLITTLRLCT